MQGVSEIRIKYESVFRKCRGKRIIGDSSEEG
jgi:hypothetical protein